MAGYPPRARVFWRCSVSAREGYILRETERLSLFIAGSRDTARVAAYVRRNRGHLAATAPARAEAYYDEQTWSERLRERQESMNAGTAVPLFLVDRKAPEGAILGDVTFSNILRGPFSACFLGYNLDREHVGQGLMFEALSSAKDYVFGELRLHRIMANYMPTNQRSGRLLRRLGFTVEGYARDYLFLAGAWQDHILAALVNPMPFDPGAPGEISTVGKLR